jgi:fluoroacetyl-CoA thioesterase
MGETVAGTGDVARFVPGLRAEETIVVTVEQTAAHAGNDPDVLVFSTPHMLILIEHACGLAIKPALTPDERLVGAAVTMRHLGATPVGERVTAHATLIEVEDNRIVFNVTVSNEHEPIGDARMEFRVIDLPRFQRGLARARRQTAR